MTGEFLFQRIAGCLNLTSKYELVNRMARHYMTLHLLRPNGTWISPLYSHHAHALLPSSITRDDGIALLRRIRAAAHL
jgi:hypothetical protein